MVVIVLLTLTLTVYVTTLMIVSEHMMIAEYVTDLVLLLVLIVMETV